MLLYDLLKAFLIGICASAPIGPVALFVLQKSLNYGWKAGFTSGLGSALMDTTYASLSLLALTVAESFISHNEVIIDFVGGAIIAVIGIVMVIRNPFRERNTKVGGDFFAAGYAAQTFLMALSNPVALFVMFGLFASFDVEVEGCQRFAVLPMVFAGAMTYWTFFSWAFSHLKKAINYKALALVGKMAGLVIVAFGVVLISRGIIEVI